MFDGNLRLFRLFQKFSSIWGLNLQNALRRVFASQFFRFHAFRQRDFSVEFMTADYAPILRFSFRLDRQLISADGLHLDVFRAEAARIEYQLQLFLAVFFDDRLAQRKSLKTKNLFLLKTRPRDVLLVVKVLRNRGS